MKADKQKLEYWHFRMKEAEEKPDRKSELIRILGAIVESILINISNLPGWLIFILKLIGPISKILADAQAAKEVVEKIKE